MQTKYKSIANWAFWLLIILNNITALIFLSMAFLSSPPSDKFTTMEIVARLFVYGFTISIFFSVITICLKFLFKETPKIFSVGYSKLFLMQVTLLVMIFTISFISFYFPV
jgi:putative copper export protein